MTFGVDGGCWGRLLRVGRGAEGDVGVSFRGFWGIVWEIGGVFLFGGMRKGNMVAPEN